jgi:hypothetical protein
MFVLSTHFVIAEVPLFSIEQKQRANHFLPGKSMYGLGVIFLTDGEFYP